MIYSVLILVILVFLFFVVFDNFRKTRKEQYINSHISKLKSQFKDKLKDVTDKNVKNFIDLVVSKSDKITKDEAQKIMNDNNLITGVYKVIKQASS